MATLLDLYNLVVQFFNSIVAFISDGIYTLLKDFTAWLVINATIQLIDFKIWMIGFSWDVAKQVLIDLGFTDKISKAYSALDSNLVAFASSIRLPASLNLVFTAYVSKYVMRMFGF